MSEWVGGGCMRLAWSLFNHKLQPTVPYLAWLKPAAQE